MELQDLGFDLWFQQQREELNLPEFSPARITRVDRDQYLVRNGQREVQAEPTGKLLYSADSPQDLPCVGDWVLVQYYNDDELAIIHQRLPRKTFLRRKSAGSKVDFQMIAANIDVAFIMQSCDTNFNLRRLERYLVMVNEGDIEPVILLSKVDLISAGHLEKLISRITEAHIAARIIAFSNTTAIGLEIIRQSLQKAKTYCLLGSSGVGKTTLLNHLLGRDAFRTNPVREKDSRGKHTTSNRQLTVLDNGALLIDTPGMKELGVMAVKRSIDESFSDIHDLSSDCRFTDCTHTVEAGCAVRQAVDAGELVEERYRNYLKLTRESDFHQLSYIEKRRKDKQFGRMIKTALKQLPKRKSSK